MTQYILVFTLIFYHFPVNRIHLFAYKHCYVLNFILIISGTSRYGFQKQSLFDRYLPFAVFHIHHFSKPALHFVRTHVVAVSFTTNNFRCILHVYRYFNVFVNVNNFMLISDLLQSIEYFRGHPDMFPLQRQLYCLRSYVWFTV